MPLSKTQAMSERYETLVTIDRGELIIERHIITDNFLNLGEESEQKVSDAGFDVRFLKVDVDK